MNAEILSKANEIIRDSNFTKIIKARKNAALHHCVVNTMNFAIYISYTSKAVHVVDNNGNAYELK
jgi:hypothetical protein